MPNDQDTTGDELELQVIAESESVEDTVDTEENDGEQQSEDTQVNLETDEPQVEKLSPQEENAKRQEEAWLSKVVSGKAQVEDAPSWLQGKLNARLEAANKLPDTEEVVRKVLEKEREKAEFKELQARIPKLTAAQAQELQARYSVLKAAGPVVALTAVLDAMGLSQKLKEAEARGIAKGKMSLPRSGQPAVKKPSLEVGGVPMDVVTDDRKWRQMIMQGKTS